MSVAAAIRITSPDEKRVIERAANFARQQGEKCFVVCVVPERGAAAADDAETVRRNFDLIADAHAIGIIQEGNDIAKTLVAFARGFGIRALFLRNGPSRLLGRTIAEKLLCLHPPFDVIVVGSE